MITEYEKDLLELIPESTLIINTERYDGYVQSAELALFLLENNRRPEILEVSAWKLLEVSLKLKIAHRILAGNIERRISKYIREQRLKVRTIPIIQILMLICISKKRRIELDEYEWSCYQASIRNRDYSSRLSEIDNVEEKMPKKHLFFFKLSLLILEKMQPKHVVITNGRFTEQTLIYLACRRLDIKVTMLEGGGRPYTFELFATSPHNASAYRKRVFSFNASSETKPNTDFHGNAQTLSWLGEATNDALVNTFAKRQQDSIGVIPELREIDLSNTVVYYSSSFWEYPSIPEFNHLSPSDVHREHVVNLSRACKELSLQLLIKIHPNPDNPKYEHFENTIWIELCKGLNIRYLPAECTVKTSDLIRSCWINVVEASGVSLECVAFGFPVITLEETPWFSPNEVPIPASFEDLKNQLLSRRVYSPSLVNAYLNYRNYGGIPYKHFRVSGQEIRLQTGQLVASTKKFDRISQIRSNRIRDLSDISVLSHDRDKFSPSS